MKEYRKRVMGITKEFKGIVNSLPSEIRHGITHEDFACISDELDFRAIINDAVQTIMSRYPDDPRCFWKHHDIDYLSTRLWDFDRKDIELMYGLRLSSAMEELNTIDINQKKHVARKMKEHREKLRDSDWQKELNIKLGKFIDDLEDIKLELSLDSVEINIELRNQIDSLLDISNVVMRLVEDINIGSVVEDRASDTAIEDITISSLIAMEWRCRLIFLLLESAYRRSGQAEDRKVINEFGVVAEDMGYEYEKSNIHRLASDLWKYANIVVGRIEKRMMSQ